MPSSKIYVHAATIRANRIVLYSRRMDEYARMPRTIGLSTTRTGLSYKAKRRMADSINTLVSAAAWKTVFQKSTRKYFRFKLNFITLTLSSQQRHGDSEVYVNVFKPFLRELRKKYPGFLYIWKAEVQDNGNIHFHLTSNTFVHHVALRDMWNRAQNRLNYVANCRVENPNSTDVHCVKNVKKIAAYLATYMTKKDLYKEPLKRYFKRHGTRLYSQKPDRCNLPKNYFNNIKRQITDIRIWDCSSVLKGVKASVIAPPDELYNELYIHQTTGAHYKKYDYCEVTYMTPERLKETRYIKSVWRQECRAALAKEAEASKYFEIE